MPFLIALANLSRRCWGYLLLASILLAGPPAAFGDGPGEYSVKLAFIYNFTQYIEWPRESMPRESMEKGQFNFCVLGPNPFGPSLELIKKKQVRGLPIEIRALGGAREAGTCHLVFIPPVDEERLPILLKSLDHPGLLTIADQPAGESGGAIITLKLLAGKVRFAINPGLAKERGLTIRSQLLNLAEIVE